MPLGVGSGPGDGSTAVGAGRALRAALPVPPLRGGSLAQRGPGVRPLPGRPVGEVTRSMVTKGGAGVWSYTTKMPLYLAFPVPGVPCTWG